MTQQGDTPFVTCHPLAKPAPRFRHKPLEAKQKTWDFPAQVSVSGKGFMRGKALGFAVAVAITGLAAGSAIAATCNDSTEKAAFHVRALQTDLMVAALTCGARPQYNSFARKFQDTLIDHGVALKALFRNLHGASSEKALNAYITALANRASQRSIAKRDQYCEHTLRTFTALTGLKPADLAAFSMSRPTSEVDVPSTCRPDVILVDKSK
jgi:hypothetical protein